MWRTKVKIDGVLCWYQRMSFTLSSLNIRKNANNGSDDICPMCGQAIDKPETDVYLIMNNHTLFPNTFVHADCIDSYQFEEATRILMDHWAIAQTYRGW